jgi:hypothetical protein
MKANWGKIIKTAPLTLTLGVILLSIFTGLTGAAISAAGTIAATATVVSRTCTVSTPSTALAFTGVVPGGTVPTKANPYPINIKNTGTAIGELYVSGTDWSGKGTINANATQWATNSGSRDSRWWGLNSTVTDTGMNVTPNDTQELFFRLNITSTSVAAGTYTQTITLSTSC